MLQDGFRELKDHSKYTRVLLVLPWRVAYITLCRITDYKTVIWLAETDCLLKSFILIFEEIFYISPSSLLSNMACIRMLIDWMLVNILPSWTIKHHDGPSLLLFPLCQLDTDGEEAKEMMEPEVKGGWIPESLQGGKPLYWRE